MDRRDFLKGAAALTALSALSGLGIDGRAGENTVRSSGPQITRRRYRNTDLTLPLLGFGMMRLPTRGEGVDDRKAAAMVERALAAGLNYFDTAYMYHHGDSEKFIGRVLSRYPREAYWLTDKLPVWQLHSEAEMERTFAEQLRRTRAGYFDFCFLHWMTDSNWEHAKQIRAYEFLKRKQQQGLIRRVGFSYHGGPAVLEEIAKSRDWDLAQVQMNYRDWDTAGRELYEVLTRRGIPIAVMGPLGGGALASLSPRAEALLRRADPQASPASWMLRFIGSLSNVQVVLSGMSTMEQLEDNIGTFTDFKPLTDAEREVMREAARVSDWKRTGTSCCTACRYCMPCPVGVRIPEVFRLYNRYKEDGDLRKFRESYRALEEDERADACVNCGACLRKCPQRIDIPAHMKSIAAEFGN
ncbi:MAG: aldo/keto reductase [Lentisphaeria bacterium]|nr:aldo/keto reductase [Lentisphaeria bacterium]